jgi:hypothetical protein
MPADMRHAFFLLPLLALPLATAACPTERMPPPKDALAPEDEWSRIPPSKEWLYATSEFNGPHKAECEHVLGWVKGEDACKASFCEHGRDLAGEWLTRCTNLAPPEAVATVRGLQGTLGGRTSEKPSDCARRYEDLVRDGCGEDKTCEATGQRWATRCAKSEGTPLVLRILQRTIERKMEQGADPLKLDHRTCEELRVDVMEAGRCKDRFVCADAIPKVTAYRDRCETEADRPSLAVAVAEMTVLVGSGKPSVEPILINAGGSGLEPGQVPVMLEDKSGGVITVCEERASDLERYVNARRGCSAGKMVVARAFQNPSHGVEVRAGSLDFPDDATFSARYPTIVGAGELELRDRELAAALGAELGKAADLGRTAAGAAEAGRMVAKAAITHALAIKRSPAVRAVFAKHDGDLAPALREIARAKIAATKGKVAPADAAGLLNRGKTRAFADLAADGSVQIDAASRGFTLDTTTFLPRATESYFGVLKAARPRKVDAKTVKAEKARGTTEAQTCGAWIKKLSETKKALASCNFGLEPCDDAKQAALVKGVDEARRSVESAFHSVETTRTGGAADEAEAITRAAEAAGCREPWW